jgi:hypothetical protein
VLLLTIMTAPAFAQSKGGDPSKVGDLVGNLPFVVYLLIPLALVLALITALLLGSTGDPSGSVRRVGGVSRALGRAESSATHPQS